MSPEINNSNSSSIHENTSSPIEAFKNRSSSNSSFEALTSSRNLLRDHQYNHPNEYVISDTIPSCTSSDSSLHFAYPSERTSPSIYKFSQAGYSIEHFHANRLQRGRQNSTFTPGTSVTNSTAQEAPPPLFDPFILMDCKVEPRTYNLIIRQSPFHGQMCSLGSKERKILDPLPIVQLDMRDRTGKRDIIGQSSPLLIMQVNLIAEQIEAGGVGSAFFERNEIGCASNSPKKVCQSLASTADSSTNFNRVDSSGLAPVIESTTRVATTKINQELGLDSPFLPKSREAHFSVSRLLEGKLTTSPHIVKDVQNTLGILDTQERIRFDLQKRYKGERNHERSSLVPVPFSMIAKEAEDEKYEDQKACFFIFTDLSIRLRGVFRLEFSLIRLGSPSSSTLTHKASAGKIVAKTISESFPMHHARDFAGMTESTPLAKSLSGQGIHIPIRNGSHWKGGLLQPPRQTQKRKNKIHQGHKFTTSGTDDVPFFAGLTAARSSSTPQYKM